MKSAACLVDRFFARTRRTSSSDQLPTTGINFKSCTKQRDEDGNEVLVITIETWGGKGCCVIEDVEGDSCKPCSNKKNEEPNNPYGQLKKICECKEDCRCYHNLGFYEDYFIPPSSRTRKLKVGDRDVRKKSPESQGYSSEPDFSWDDDESDPKSRTRSPQETVPDDKDAGTSKKKGAAGCCNNYSKKKGKKDDDNDSDEFPSPRPKPKERDEEYSMEKRKGYGDHDQQPSTREEPKKNTRGPCTRESCLAQPKRKTRVYDYRDAVPRKSTHRVHGQDPHDRKVGYCGDGGKDASNRRAKSEDPARHYHQYSPPKRVMHDHAARPRGFPFISFGNVPSTTKTCRRPPEPERRRWSPFGRRRDTTTAANRSKSRRSFDRSPSGSPRSEYGERGGKSRNRGPIRDPHRRPSPSQRRRVEEERRGRNRGSVRSHESPTTRYGSDSGERARGKSVGTQESPTCKTCNRESDLKTKRDKGISPEDNHCQTVCKPKEDDKNEKPERQAAKAPLIPVYKNEAEDVISLRGNKAPDADKKIQEPVAPRPRVDYKPPQREEYQDSLKRSKGKKDSKSKKKGDDHEGKRDKKKEDLAEQLAALFREERSESLISEGSAHGPTYMAIDKEKEMRKGEHAPLLAEFPKTDSLNDEEELPPSSQGKTEVSVSPSGRKFKFGLFKRKFASKTQQNHHVVEFKVEKAEDNVLILE